MNLDSAKPTLDLGAIGVAGGVFLKWLPDITAVFALIYLLIRITETERFKQFTSWLRNLFKGVK